MDFEPSRLRRGELIAAGSAVALLIVMFGVKWFGVGGAVASRPGGSSSVNAWHGLTILRWLMLVTIIATLALGLLQATQHSPAMPVTASLMVMLLGALLAILLAYRVLINAPGPDLVEPKLGAFLGVLSAIGIAYGGYESLRKEGLAKADARTGVETVPIGAARRP